MVDGNLYTGNGGRIVGPENASLALSEAINDPDLQVAFIETTDVTAAQIISRRGMQQVGEGDFPVLVLPLAVKELWEANPGPLNTVYTGELPVADAQTSITSFGIVKPGGAR